MTDYAFWSKAALGVFYLMTFAIFWYGHKYRDWPLSDVVGITALMVLLLLVTISVEATQ